MLRSLDRQSITDVSVKPVGHIFKGQAVQERPAELRSRLLL